MRRGETVEARHRVHAVAVRDGEVVAAAGDPALVCLFRSSAKPIQALLLARARPDLGDREIAIACASHRAEPAQIEAVRSLLAKGPATEDDLECGEQEGRAPGAIHHNCSGKHAGFLAVCLARGWETAGYRSPSTRCRRSCTRRWREPRACGTTEIPTAVDGCGVVTFALSLERMARVLRRARRPRRRRPDPRRHARAPRARGRRGLARHAPHGRQARLGGERRRRGPALRRRAGRDGLRAEVRGRQPSPSPGGARAVSRSRARTGARRELARRGRRQVVGRDRRTWRDRTRCGWREAGRGWTAETARWADRDRRLRPGHGRACTSARRCACGRRSATGSSGSSTRDRRPCRVSPRSRSSTSCSRSLTPLTRTAYMPDLEAAGYVLSSARRTGGSTGCSGGLTRTSTSRVYGRM